jgi:hypothetical protein
VKLLNQKIFLKRKHEYDYTNLTVDDQRQDLPGFQKQKYSYGLNSNSLTAQEITRLYHPCIYSRSNLIPIRDHANITTEETE